MRNTLLVLAVSLTLFSFQGSARADVDLTLAGLLGTGVDTGDGDNNPYAFQLGGAIELSISGFVVGFRGIRTLGTNVEKACDRTNECDVQVNDLRSMGGDLGYEWSFALLHLGPRFGIGHVREVDSGRKALYLDPGAVLDVELGPFLAGVDLRYRIAPGEDDLAGLLAYARLGLRF